MEIRDGDRLIRLEFGQDEEIYVEWCDGLERGVHLLPAEADSRVCLCQMLLAVVQNTGAQRTFSAGEGALQVMAHHLDGYYRMELAYVPEEDLLPWQWLRVADVFREAEVLAMLQTV